MSPWIDWTRAVALSRALDGTPALESAAPAFGSAEDAACAHTRITLTRAIADGLQNIAATHPGGGNADDEGRAERPEADYAVFRQHHVAMQRSMQAATGRLRGRLRDMLAATSADMARLAAVDAVMEGVLSPREHALLAEVPTLLGEHFECLRLAAHAACDTASPAAWLDVFRRDMQGVLIAELDVRFLPLESLLAALRTHSQGRHVQTAA